MSYQISKRADADLDEIWEFIAEDNPDAADRVERKIHDAIKMLGQMPNIGHLITETRPTTLPATRPGP